MRQMRLFIAVNFPETTKKSLGSVINELRRLPADAKWVEEENLHLTLQFLGNVPEEQVPSIVSALQRASAGVGPFQLSLGGTGVFPSAERPRVLWVGAGGATTSLARLQRQVQDELAALGFEPEKRRFSPHLTLARLRSPQGFGALLERARQLCGRPGQFGPAKIDSVDLMLSELGSRGAKYFILAGISLTGLKK